MWKFFILTISFLLTQWGGVVEFAPTHLPCVPRASDIILVSVRVHYAENVEDL